MNHSTEWIKIPLHHALQDQGFSNGNYSLYHWVKTGPHKAYWILHHNENNPPTVGRLDGSFSVQYAKGWANEKIKENKMNQPNSSSEEKCVFKFNLQIEVDQGDWDSGTPFDLIHRLQKVLEDKQWFGDAQLISCKHTPYPGDKSHWANTLNGELIEPSYQTGKLYDSPFGIYCSCVYNNLEFGCQPMVIEHIVETIVGEDNTVSGLRCPKCGAHWAIHEV